MPWEQEARLHAFLFAGCTADTYPRSLARLHWAVAAGLGANVALGYAAARWGPTRPRLQAALNHAHTTLGVGLLVATGVRLATRMRAVLPPPVPGPLLAQVAALGTHAALYAVTLALPLSGLAIAWFGGRAGALFGLLPLSACRVRGRHPRDARRAQTARRVHALCMRALSLLAFAHLGAVLVHQVAHGHNLLDRMLP